MKKTILFLSIFVLLTAALLSACQSKIVGSDSITGGVVGSIAYGDVKLERQGNKLVPIKEFTMVANPRSGYDPNTLQVNKGDFVRIVIYVPGQTSGSATVGFALPAFGINEKIEGQNYKKIEFTADEAGTYSFYSQMYVGPNTKNMVGKLIVKDIE